MYRLIVRQLALAQFRRLSAGNTGPIIASMRPNVTHYFPGDHAPSGRRSNRDGITRWFARLTRLLPEMTFTVQGVATSGGPGTMIAVEWTAVTPLIDGTNYDNRGTRVIRLRWGKVVRFHAYMDSQPSADALRRLALTAGPDARRRSTCAPARWWAARHR